MNIPRILSGDKTADILIGDGDRIIVPRLDNSVTVIGEVYEPGSHRFLPERSMEDYIDLAAGLTNRARGRSAYIIEADGSVQTRSRS